MAEDERTTEPRVALIGSGYWGKNLARNFNDLGALATICETDPDLQASLKEQYPDCTVVSSLDAVLADETVQAVAIATPAETHYDLVKQCLGAGKDVFVEKPLALHYSDGAELVTMADAADRILMVGHLLWYHPAVLKLKDLINEGELGRIRYIYSNRLNMGKIRREENILWSFAPHDISVILGLLDETPSIVNAQGGNYLHEQIADVTVSTLAFPSGVRAHVFVSWLHPFKEQKLVVVGEDKMAVLDDVEKEDKLVLYPHTIEWKGQVPVANKATGEPVPLETEEPLRAECSHFLECVKTRQTPRTDGVEALRVLDVLEQCQLALSPDAGQPAGGEQVYSAHETAVIDENVSIGEGTKVWHFSHVMDGTTIGMNCRIGQNVVVGPNAEVGNGVKIQNNVSVYEGVTLEDNVFCGPSMVFTNVFNPRSEIPRMSELRPTMVREGATLGANCTIVCGNTVGKYAFVGAGAVVTKDIPDYALISGVPGKQVGWMCKCGLKLTFKKNAAKCECGHSYEKTGDVIVQSSGE